MTAFSASEEKSIDLLFVQPFEAQTCGHVPGFDTRQGTAHWPWWGDCQTVDPWLQPKASKIVIPKFLWREWEL